MKDSINKEEIRKLLPHREPMLLVDELINQNQEAGYHSITWNASNQASGMYFAKMIAGDVVQTQKLILLK